MPRAIIPALSLLSLLHGQAARAAQDGTYIQQVPNVSWGTLDESGRERAALYDALASGLNLDMARFGECLNDPAQSAEIDADFVHGQSVGVQGTPSFFIGRVSGSKLVQVQILTGSQPFATFARVLNAILE